MTVTNAIDESLISSLDSFDPVSVLLFRFGGKAFRFLSSFTEFPFRVIVEAKVAAVSCYAVREVEGSGHAKFLSFEAFNVAPCCT